MTDEALETALSLFAHAGTKQAVVVRSSEHYWTIVWREARQHCEIAGLAFSRRKQGFESPRERQQNQ